jgi:glycosyltransferase involved in cell wall biosynthesis
VASNLGYRLEGEELNQWTAFISNIGSALAQADSVITTNGFLAERIAEVVEKRIHVIPNSLNEAQLEASRGASQATHRPGAGLRIGYFSGSHSHSHDFRVVEQALFEYLQHSESASLTIVGHLVVPPSFERFGSRVNVKPFMDFLGMQQLLADIDLNIVPLQTSPFTHSKSELKYFEAAAVGVVTVASPAPVFTDAITHGQNGFLADGLDWPEVLEHVVSLSKDDYAAVTHSALDHITEKYHPDAISPHIAQTLRQLSST